MNKNISPCELDSQSTIKIDEWLDINSERYKYLDNDRANSKYFMKIGFESGFMFTDKLGRVWGYNSVSNSYYPFHFNVGKKLYGFRLSVKAAN